MLEPARRNGGRAAVGLLAVALHLSFAVLAAMPQVVFCHRADGCVAVEFSGPAGVCLCAECEHCLERLVKDRHAETLSGASLEACHCHHEPVRVEAAALSLRRDNTGSKLGAGFFSPLPSPGLPGRGSAESRPTSSDASPPANRSSGSLSLRC